MDIKDEILFLRKKLSECDKKYYIDDEPEIEDYEYDALKRRLEILEREHPEFASCASPVNIVGGVASSKFSPVRHDIKMESLHDSFSMDEIRSFYDRVCGEFEDSEFVVEKKIDGLSLSVEYVNGILYRASTRGNGIVGEDITENALTIKNLPHKIDSSIEYLEVRGECFMPKESFANLVKIQESEGKKVFKNPRNAAAGSIRQKNSDVCKVRDLRILFFNVQKVSNLVFDNHSESLKFLKNLGLPVVDFMICKNFDQIASEIEKIDSERKNCSYQTDGAVVKINNLKKREILGSTSSYPRWAEAFKYPPEVKKSKCLRIDVSVGRTGVLTPICVFEPVNIGGALISKASLHNEEFIKSKDVRVGDLLYVIKAGDVIPEVSKVEIDNSCERAEKFQMPFVCPSCNSKIYVESSKDGNTYRCKNENCPSRLKAKILHFVSRNAMDIDGFGEETFEVLKNELKDCADIYNLDENTLKKYDEFRNKKTSNDQEIFQGFDTDVYINKTGKNLLDSIRKSKSNSLERLIYGLGIPLVGKEIASLISSYFMDIKRLSLCTIDEVSSIDGIGEVISESIVNFFKKNKDLIDKLIKSGLNIKYTSNKVKNYGEICCITGKFEKYTRSEIIDILSDKNIGVSPSVSKNTTFLLCGKNPGSKLEKAKKLGVKIISEDNLDDFISELDSFT